MKNHKTFTSFEMSLICVMKMILAQNEEDIRTAGRLCDSIEDDTNHVIDHMLITFANGIGRGKLNNGKYGIW